MKKKIVALILLIPLLLVFTTFSLANVVVLTVPVPVTGVKLHMNEVEYLDVSESCTLKILSEVLPENAKEKGVVYSCKKVEGKTEADISIDEDGNLKALSLGSTNVIVTTKDGGYKAGFILEVTSKSAVRLSFEKNELLLQEGESENNVASIAPFGALDKNVEYASNDVTVAKVNPMTGVVTGICPGEAVVTATLRNGVVSDNGTWNKQKIETSYRVTVTENVNESVVVNGKTGAEITEYAGARAELLVSVLNSELMPQTSNIRGAGKSPFAVSNDSEEKLKAFYRYAILSDGKYTAEILRETNTKTVYRLTLKLDGTDEKTLSLGKNSVVKLKSLNRLDSLSICTASRAILVGERVRLGIETMPESPEGLTLAFRVGNDEIADIVSEENGTYFLVAKKEGDFELEVSATVGNTVLTEKAKFTVLETPGSINFRLNTTVWGIKERFAFASKKYVDGIEAKDSAALDLISNRAVDMSLYEFVSSDNSVAKVTGNRLSVLGNGTVTITAKLKNAEELGLTDEFSATLILDCVDGINVADYAALMYASTAGRKIVLQSNVSVGVDVTGKSDEEKSAILNSELTAIDTTADWSFYKNSGQTSTPPTVKVAVEFKDDVYGNGYTLNAHNITAVMDYSGKSPVGGGFTGPLNMVAVNIGGLGASVKAQDNIVFLVKNDNVKIDNVELMSRTLSPNADGLVELNDLNYAGTTLEIMGDGVTLQNSRVRNGRTAVRIFGGSNPDKKINVLIESCILSYAREFTLKIGTNKTLPSDSSALQPDLSVNGKTYQARDDRNFDDEDFVRKFLKTDVTVKNTVFTTSGIFPVGIESKFGGSAFREGKGYYFEEWKDASGTSYAARLNLEGDVGLYDWKNVDSIDSGTLIETTKDDPRLNFDVSEILRRVRKKYPDRFGTLLTDLDGITYAHGGIAFYGGGKNYSCVDFSGLRLDSYLNGLKELSVPLTIIDNADILVSAAGEEPFRFYMFSSDSEMNVLKQAELLESGKAYDAVKPAITN